MKSARQIKIRKRSNNSYELRYTKEHKQYSIYGTSKAECREKYLQIFKQSKKPPQTKGMTFGTWFEKWIDLYKKPNVKYNTLKNIIGMFKNYVLDKLAHKTLRSIKTEDIQLIINDMSKYSRQATILYLNLQACFQQAFLLNLINYNPCSAVVIKKNKGGKGKSLTQEEQQKLIEYLNENNPPIKNLILLYLSTGMRRSELLSITRKDLNFNTNEITIKGTKTKGSTRTIQTQRKVLDLFPNNDTPFYNWTPTKVNKDFKTICDLLNFDKISIHSLRHTFATNCIQNEIPMVVVQQWLGHTSIGITIDTYTHIETSFKIEQTSNLPLNFLP